jgi:hypothetical protein
MKILPAGPRSFDALDYSVYNHIINQKKISWFITTHNFSTEYNLLSRDNLCFVNFSIKKVVIKNMELNAVLIYVPEATNVKFCLEIFPESKAHWERFTETFDDYITTSINTNEAYNEILNILRTGTGSSKCNELVA